MKAKTKSTLKNTFFSLVSNNAAIEGSKNSPWWVGIILALIAIFIPVVPVMVRIGSSTGSSTLANYNYGVDQALASSLTYLKDEGYTAIVDENQVLNLTHNGDQLSNDEEGIIYSYVNKATNQYDLQIVYYAEDDFTTAHARVDANPKCVVKYKQGTTELADTTAEDVNETSYIPSYLLLYKGGLFIHVYQHNLVDKHTGSSSSPNWDNTKKNEDLFTRILTVQDVAESNLNNKQYVEGTFNNFKAILDETYLTARGKALSVQTFVFLGIYAVMILVMGLLLFILTRGKNNMFNYLKWWDTQKMVFWVSLSPAILSLILGFMFTQMANMLFIVLLGFRVMWLSMRQLRPQY